ncbi:MAG: serine/threonine protein kinase [Planctomycetes bacterium]|nr:serine/threonine protein kinase [Planctomycetota bacterium]
MAPGEDAELELLALARLGLADRLAGAPDDVVRDARAEGLAALERHGLLKPHQARAVRAYVQRQARPCACGRRVLMGEEGGVVACVCGADVSASGGVAPRRAPQGAIGPGTRVGPLEVLEKLGQGASGTVFRARHVELGRLSALKVIARGGLDARRRRRFEREVEALARLDHPAIVKVHAPYEHEGSLAFDMELVDGQPLDERLDRGGPLPWREAVALVASLARAIEHAHEHGVLHRDLKPGNVLLRADGRALIADLGLSRLTDQSSSLTMAGAPIGTPCYMAPEAFAGESTPQVDVYGLGAILYQCLTGRPPFLADSLPALLHQVTRGQCEPTAAPGAPAALEAVRACAMAVRPERRYATAGALADDLEAVLAGRATSASSTVRLVLPRTGLPAGVLVAGLAALGLLVAVAAVALRGPRPDAPPQEEPSPVTLAQALDALARGAHREAALSIATRAARQDEGRAALDEAITRAPASPHLRLARAAADRAARRPLDADDLLRAASASPDPLLVEALAQHAADVGLAGGARLDAARALAAAHPASRAAATLLGLGALRRRRPRRARRGGGGPGRGAGAHPRARRLLGALALVDRIVERLAAGAAIRDDAQRLAEDLQGLEPAAARVLLAPLAAPVRRAMKEGPLGDLVVGEPRRSLVALADAAPDLPDLLLVCLAILRDTDSELKTPPDAHTPEALERLERAARAELEAEPLVAAFALQLAAHRRLGRLRERDDARAAALEAAERDARRVADAVRAVSEPEALWAHRTVQRATADLAELERRRAGWALDPAARRAHQEGALALAVENFEITGRQPQVFAHRRQAAEDLVRMAVALERHDLIEPAVGVLRHPDALWADLHRRRGDPARAREVAQAAVDAAAKPPGELLGALALALADLGRLDEARAAHARMASGDKYSFDWLTPQAVEAYLAGR